jgi:hypothetical protein
LISREKSSDRPLGEKSAPISVALTFTSGGSLTRFDQPRPVRRDS